MPDPEDMDVEAALEDACDSAVEEAQSHYDEYLRMLDDLPVLSDVVSEPPRRRIRDFRRGERPDARRAPREDPYTLREQQALEIERRYCEYAAFLATPDAPAAPRARRVEPRKRRAKGTGRSKRRKA